MTVRDQTANFQPGLFIPGYQATMSPVRRRAHSSLAYPPFPIWEKHTVKKPGTYITAFHYHLLHHPKEISIAAEQNKTKNKQKNCPWC